MAGDTTDAKAASGSDAAPGAFPRTAAPFGPVVDEGPDLTRDEVKRYSRHLIMPEVGMEGQRQLKNAKVLIVGTGGLGSPLGMYLAAAGVGTLGIVDFDAVDHSNLQRQVLFDTDDVGRRKVVAAKERIEGINPGVDVEVHETRLTSDNALEIIEPYDVVVDGTDNFPTRYLVNDACVLLGKPNVYGSIFRFEGQASVFWAEHGPCYRCLYPQPPPPGLVPSCAEGGVLGILPGIVGNLQAMEAVKVILGKGEPLVGRLLLFDAMAMEFRELQLNKNPDCPVCGDDPEVTELIDYEAFCGIRGEEHEEEVGQRHRIDVRTLAQRLDKGDDGLFILDVRNPNEYEICNLDGTLIPLHELAERVHEVPQDRDVVVHCRTGGRSSQAVNFLKEMGFDRVYNLVGGIKAWAEEIDPEMPTY